MNVSQSLVKLVVLLSLVQCSLTVSVGQEDNISLDSEIRIISNSEREERALDDLPDVFADDHVKQMVQMLMAQDLQLEAEHKQRKRQYKRDIYSTSASTISTSTFRSTPTRKVQPMSSQKTTKQQKPNKTSGTSYKNKNRPSTTPAMAASAKSTSKPLGDTKIKPNVAPTKYHYYPHNQHLYFLPECAIQQVCNAVYVRLNYTQPLCACPPRYRDPCSASLNEDDNHTIKLIGNAQKRAITLAKTCEQTNELRDCRAPRDWSILALQNTRTGKSHYLIICKCPSHFRLEGPLAHDQPTYAGLPGINVHGMLCVPDTLQEPSAPHIVKLNNNNRWSANRRPSISTVYRSKNSTIEATVDDETTEKI